MGNYFTDNQDLRFYVDKWVDWEPLVRLTEYNWQSEDGFKNTGDALEFYRGVLDMVGRFTADEIAPYSPAIDRSHPFMENGEVRFPPVLQGIFDKLRPLDLHGMCIPRELGGLNTPFLLFNLCTEMFARADVSVGAHNGFHGGMAMAMLLFSVIEGSTAFTLNPPRITSTRFRDEISEIISGRAWGSMDITESGAGSDMAALRTKGEQDETGEWFVTGEKIFITSGHARYHFVIARTEKREGDDAFAGLKGLSMFLVQAYTIGPDGNRKQLAEFAKLEEKLGHHGSATVAISFDRTPAQLIGRRGDGFKLMLQLMNNARIGVGIESLGLCEAAYRLAVAYAAERPSMGKTIDRHEMIAGYLDEMRTDIQAIRALAVESAYHEEMAQKLRLLQRFLPPADPQESRKLQADLKRHQKASRRLTPLLKYYAAEKAVEIARRCIQIHGGYGYIAEYGAEKLLRDAMVLPIYEGTSQIQALMAMKDSLMGIVGDPAGFIEGELKARLRSHSSSGFERRVARLQGLSASALRFLLTRLAGKKLGEMTSMPLSEWSAALKRWNPKRDFALAMLHAERLARLLTDTAISEILLEQAKRFPERGELLERFLERAEPRCKMLHEEITSTGGRLLAALERAEEGQEAPGA
jgi:alkylation response protein AidB-like acyl-CoA dehydrogenase